MVKLTRQQEKEVIRDTLIDWMDRDAINNMVEFIVDELVSSQRKNILDVLENEYNTEMTKAAEALGIIEE